MVILWTLRDVTRHENKTQTAITAVGSLPRVIKVARPPFTNKTAKRRKRRIRDWVDIQNPISVRARYIYI